MPDFALSHTIFDLETTGTSLENAHIVEIAALAPNGDKFHRYVTTALEDSDEIWNEVCDRSKLDKTLYIRERQPLIHVLQEFLDFVGDTPLAGHNINAFDIPMLDRHLKEVGLAFPSSARATLDSYRWANLVFPTLPESLGSYRLGDLYTFFADSEPSDAHQADADCRYTLEVMRGLAKRHVPFSVLQVWKWLELPEAHFYDATPLTKEDLQRVLEVQARVPTLDQAGEPFPSPSELRSRLDVLGGERPRETQLEMIDWVSQALTNGQQLLLQAPTGTGKTRGYLFPAHHHLSRVNQEDSTNRTKVIVATHTKVLQQQAIEELKRSADQGFQTRAVLVKSARDSLCLEALNEALEGRDDIHSESGRAALGVLTHLAVRGDFDLEAIPRYWQGDAAFREALFNVQTQPSRCRPQCPFFKCCAYQIDLGYREAAPFWITNQAYLLAHFGKPQDADKRESETHHFIIDEAHNLEDVATNAFTTSVSREETLFHVWRVFDNRSRRNRGLLRDNGRVPENLIQQANRIRTELIPQTLVGFEAYSRELEGFIKAHGKGEDLEFGLSFEVGSALKFKREWPRLRKTEDAWLQTLKTLRQALLVFPRDSWLGKNLGSSLEFFKTQIDLLYERRQAMYDQPQIEADGSEPEKPTEGLLETNEQVHLTSWNPKEGWTHTAQPIDVSGRLRDVWSKAASLTLTSATLSVGSKSDFGYIKRTLGLDAPNTVKLAETLPYEKAHLIIPRHLPEARTSNLRRFQNLYHLELRQTLPFAGRSLSLFTSTKRMRQAGDALERLPNLYMPVTRREREDVAQNMRKEGDAAALGTRAYMEGVDFKDLKLVNLERIPFPVLTPLLEARQRHAEKNGLNPWSDVYLPRALLTFIQAFGRLIRDDRRSSNNGAFVLWDKRLSNASYQEIFFRALPGNIRPFEPKTRKEFYAKLEDVFGKPYPHGEVEELQDKGTIILKEICGQDITPLEKAKQIAKRCFEIDLEKDDERSRKQLEAIQAALEGRDVLTLLPTSFGKSLTFQLPALVQDEQDGLGSVTIIVSPLIALMRDQVEKLQNNDLPANALHSMISGAEQRSIMEEVDKGNISLLYVSPERLHRNQDFANLLVKLAAEKRIRRLVFDEAHCLSEWGHDFRPDYLKVAAKLREIVPDLPITALTATATPKVRGKLLEQLKLRDPITVIAPFDRENLRYFSEKRNELEKFKTLFAILQFLQDKHPKDNAIVYTSTRKQAERLAWALGELHVPNVEAYHAGLSKVMRNEVQSRFMEEDKGRIMIATNAFGMGVDQPQVRAVIHFNPPSSLPAYIQEAGRGGRDGKLAYAILLHTSNDWRLTEWLSSRNLPSSEHATNLLDFLEVQPERTWRGFSNLLLEQYNVYLENCIHIDEELLPDLDEDDLSLLVNFLEASGNLEYSYRPGKIFILCTNLPSLREALGIDRQVVFEALKRLGLNDEPEGKELDLSGLPVDQADRINSALFQLRELGHLRFYANRQPALEIKHIPGPRGKFGNDRKKLKSLYDERLEQIKHYATSNDCKRDLLLRAFEQTDVKCSGCQSCQDEDFSWYKPWEEYLTRSSAIDDETLESVYKPLETMLRFLADDELHYKDSPRFGKHRLVLSLQGEVIGKRGTATYTQGRRYQNNNFWGRLSFVREKEIERAMDKAVRDGLLEQPGGDRPVYSLTDAARELLKNRNQQPHQKRAKEHDSRR